MKKETIGQKLSVVLQEIEDTLWEYEVNVKGPPMFTTRGFAAVTKIFMAVFMDKMWVKFQKEKLSPEAREEIANLVGRKVRALIKEHTGIDMVEVYKKRKKDV